jgi:ribosomal protein S18 acetylase RimI-like enzyme
MWRSAFARRPTIGLSRLRVLTDQTARAFIVDVIVAADCRGCGLGRRVVDEVLSHPAVRNVELVELYCRPELVRFYERMGFSSPDSGVVLMRKRLIRRSD